ARNALLINLSVVLILLLAAGGYGAYRWTHRTNPRSQVERYLHAIQWLDWGVVYDLSATPPGGKTRHDFITKLDEKYDYNGVIRLSARRSYERYQFAVGEPTVQGAEATVPVTMTGPGFESGKRFELKLRNFGGVWKIYPPWD